MKTESRREGGRYIESDGGRERSAPAPGPVRAAVGSSGQSVRGSRAGSGPAGEYLEHNRAFSPPSEAPLWPSHLLRPPHTPSLCPRRGGCGSLAVAPVCSLCAGPASARCRHPYPPSTPPRGGEGACRSAPPRPTPGPGHAGTGRSRSRSPPSLPNPGERSGSARRHRPANRRPLWSSGPVSVYSWVRFHLHSGFTEDCS